MDLKSFDIKAAIFDLDGTIADSLDVWGDIDRVFFKNHSMDEPKDYQLNVQSMNFEQAASFTKKTYHITDSCEEIMNQWRELSIEEYSEKIQLKEGVFEFLSKLHENDIKIALATASGRELFEPLLKRCGVYSFFSYFITTKEAGKDKNFPDIYLKCAEKLNIDTSSCMVFEDILPGITSAHKASMKACGVFDIHSRRDEHLIKESADLYIRSFKELL